MKENMVVGSAIPANNSTIICVKVKVDSSEIDEAIAKAKELAAILGNCKAPVPDND